MVIVKIILAWAWIEWICWHVALTILVKDHVDREAYPLSILDLY